MIRADLHVHTDYSPDASIHPKTIVNHLHAHPFIKAVAITDHNTFKGYHRVHKLASAFEDITIIPGVEISAVEGELIVLGITQLPPKPWTVKNVIDFARERNGLIIVPHPYRAQGLGDQTRSFDVDAVEVLNGNDPRHLNKMAEKLAKETGLPGVAGSDAHKINKLWTVYTEVQASSDVQEILSAIQKGLTRVVSTRKSIHF